MRPDVLLPVAVREPKKETQEFFKFKPEAHAFPRSAQAYLLERLGDMQAALGIFCAAAERTNTALVARILDGSVPAGALPAPAQGRLNRAGDILYGRPSSLIGTLRQWQAVVVSQLHQKNTPPLVDCILSGSVPSGALPAPAQVRCLSDALLLTTSLTAISMSVRRDVVG